MNFAEVSGLHVGSVEASSALEVKVLLDVDAPQDLALNSGRPQGFPRLNGYVLMPNEGGAVVALISRMTMEPAPVSGSDRDTSHVNFPVARRRLFVTPLGTLESPGSGVGYRLSRGVASYPAVGDAVVLATPRQLQAIVEAHGDDRRLRIGTATAALNAPITVDPDKLFGRHLGVFGNTGSGKSCTVAGLVRWSLEAASEAQADVNARFVILDPNGEYKRCFEDLSNHIDVRVFSAEPDAGQEKLTVPGWMWNSQEWIGFLDASPGTQRPILMQAIRALRRGAVAGIDGGVAGEIGLTVFSSQTRALVTWLQGLRLEGVAAHRFPQPRDLHRNLGAYEDQLAEFAGRRQEDDALRDAMIGAQEASREARQRRTDHANDGREFVNGFQDRDFAEILAALEEMAALLPDADLGDGPTEDTPVPFDISHLPGMVSFMASITPGAVQQHVAGLDLRLKTKLSDARIAPIIAPDGAPVDFGGWLKNLLGPSDAKRGRVTVLDLSLIPSDIVSTIASVLARLVFETAQRYRREFGVSLPTVLVLEEAHNFIQRSSDHENADAQRCRHIFEKISKEGRKFGVGLLVSSQRPSELSPTIVAQCNSFVLHRIVNDRDQELVCRLAPDSSGALLKELPSLPTRKAVLLGIASEIPVVFDVQPLPDRHRPDSANPDFWSVWSGERVADHDLADVAASWLDG